MISAVIIDDEQHCIDRLVHLVREQCSDIVSVAGTFHSVEEGIAGIARLHPQLVFLDVQLGDKTGFDLLSDLADIDFEVIFITAHDQYAVQAFRFSALDYLMKPVNPKDLASAVDKLNDRLSANEQAKKIDTLFHNLKELNASSKRISIPDNNGFTFIEVGDIVRIESDANYSRIFLKDGRKLTVSRTLKDFEIMLTDFNFFRVHNSHLVNLSFIKNFQKGKGGTITLKDGTRIEVSFRRKEPFLKKISEM